MPSRACLCLCCPVARLAKLNLFATGPTASSALRFGRRFMCAWSLFSLRRMGCSKALQRLGPDRHCCAVQGHAVRRRSHHARHILPPPPIPVHRRTPRTVVALRLLGGALRHGHLGHRARVRSPGVLGVEGGEQHRRVVPPFCVRPPLLLGRMKW